MAAMGDRNAMPALEHRSISPARVKGQEETTSSSARPPREATAAGVARVLTESLEAKIQSLNKSLTNLTMVPLTRSPPEELVAATRQALKSVTDLREHFKEVENLAQTNGCEYFKDNLGGVREAVSTATEIQNFCGSEKQLRDVRYLYTCFRRVMDPSKRNPNVIHTIHKLKLELSSAMRGLSMCREALGSRL